MSNRMLVVVALGGCLVGALTLSGDARGQAADETADLVKEVLVGTSPTLMPSLHQRKGFEILNRGSVDIDCVMTSRSTAAPTITIGRARRVSASGGTFAVDAPDFVRAWCVVISGGAQTNGAGTVLSQVPRG